MCVCSMEERAFGASMALCLCRHGDYTHCLCMCVCAEKEDKLRGAKSYVSHCGELVPLICGVGGDCNKDGRRTLIN